MKKCFTLWIALLGFFVAGYGQDVFNAGEPVTWLGVDLSALQLVKGEDVISDAELQSKYFPGWNELILKEPKKFDIAKAVKRSNVEHDINAITEVNKQAKGKFIVNNSTDIKPLDDATVTKMVQKYNLKGKSGIGLVFIVESMDKVEKEATVHVTFINMQNKSVLLSKTMTGESGGFGFRNYWAASFYKILKELPSEMKKWQKG